MINADWFLNQAVKEMADRASSRDTGGERSMQRAVNAFNAMFGKDLTAVQGWQFMELLKMARSVGGEFRADDFTDGAAYAALAGEQASQKGALMADDKADAMKYDHRNACAPFVNGTVEKSPFEVIKTTQNDMVDPDLPHFNDEEKRYFANNAKPGMSFLVRTKGVLSAPWVRVKLVCQGYNGWEHWITIRADGEPKDCGIPIEHYDIS